MLEIKLRYNEKVCPNIEAIKYPSQNLVNWWRILESILSFRPFHNFSSVLVIFYNFVKKFNWNLFLFDHTFGQSIHIFFGVGIIWIEIADHDIITLVYELLQREVRFCTLCLCTGEDSICGCASGMMCPCWFDNALFWWVCITVRRYKRLLVVYHFYIRNYNN